VFTALVRPVIGHPEIEIPWIFYPADPKALDGPTTFITPRWWDERERWESTAVGIVWGSQKRYTGPVPNRPLGPVIGTPSMWEVGLDYDTYINGGYHDPVGCWPLRPTGKCVEIETSFGTISRGLTVSGACAEIEQLAGYAGPPGELVGTCVELEPATGAAAAGLTVSGACVEIEPATGTATGGGGGTIGPCLGCGEKSPATWTITVSVAGGGACSGFSGTWALTSTGDCAWYSSNWPGTDEAVWILDRYPTANWQLSAWFANGTQAAVYQVTDTNCGLPFSINLVSSPGACGWPETILLAPSP
jgi:hypothetical protein